MKTKRTKEPGQHGIRKNGRLQKFMNQRAQERYEKSKQNPTPEQDFSWMKNVPTGL